MSSSSLRTTAATQKILDLEDAAPRELFEALPGATVPFWAQVRMQLGWMLSEESTGSVAVASDNWTRRGELTRLAKAFLPNRWDAVQRARRHDVIFYVGGGTLAPRGGRARNWLVESFAESTDDALVIQRRPLPTAMGVPSFSPTLSMEGATARARLWARRYVPPVETVQTVDRLLAFFAEELGLQPAQLVPLRARVLRTEAHRPHELASLRRVVRRVRPRLVIMDTASYTYNGEAVGVFKDAGAYVVEPQHGWIGPSHAAYNYGRAFEDASLRRALPDELLTFGEFWSEGLRLPAKTTAIGKPHLEEVARSAPSVRRRQLLVISSRADPEETDRFVTELRGALHEAWSVVFRPHPAESAAVAERYPAIAAHSGIAIDRNPDVYDSLAETRAVVGVASTVLFEAAAFGCEVIARENSFASTIVGDAFGTRVRTAVEAAGRIHALADGGVVVGEPDPALWAPDSVAGYRRWLGELLPRLGP
ncbi:hypothetical protein [Microbacterium sp. W4I20]|uniref:hypothetical protein n=1 Tax=Microbacterium sp. W4I20 TaxID=3042262 RepID=UPI00278718EF|nr:hypothetical protein [Microbacterium sp. W4I20]MDQ0725943.1 glycosyltransferase involved in cell wall biosynthesis [Microbacterium sp. W4I20]